MSSTPGHRQTCRYQVEVQSYSYADVRRGTGGRTQSEASVQLQVCCEEPGQAAEQLPTGLPAVQLIAAVDQTVGRGTVVSFVQNPD